MLPLGCKARAEYGGGAGANSGLWRGMDSGKVAQPVVPIKINRRMSLTALQVVGDKGQHLVSGGNGFGVYLVSPLGFDHIDHLFHHVDVGGFQRMLD